MNTSDYLYHYTSIDTRELILKNKTIRFTSLDQMDDLQEKESNDLINFGQFYYISSWTAEEKEILPMWRDYASSDNGVRIALPKNPFKKYIETSQDIADATGFICCDEKPSPLKPCLIPRSKMFSKGFWSVDATSCDILRQVIYTDNSEKLYPTLTSKKENVSYIFLKEMGVYKNTYWEYQKEWRYIMFIVPLDLKTLPELALFNFVNLNINIKNGSAKQLFPYYDLSISDEAFTKMKIMLGPEVKADKKEYVKDLVSKYNPSATVEKSELSGLVRHT